MFSPLRDITKSPLLDYILPDAWSDGEFNQKHQKRLAFHIILFIFS